MSEEFENGWGVHILSHGFYVDDEGLLEVVVLKDGDRHYNNPVAMSRVWLTNADIARLSAIVESWAPDQTFPDNIELYHYVDDLNIIKRLKREDKEE